MVSDLWHYYCNSLGAAKLCTYNTGNLNVLCVLAPPLNSCFHLSLLETSYSLKHNNIAINNVSMPIKC